MALRICLVTPFAWSQPHDVNEHVTGVAAALRELGHSVTVLAPSNRARDLVAGRRALHEGKTADVIAVGPAVPVSRRSKLGVPAWEVDTWVGSYEAIAAGEFETVDPALATILERPASDLKTYLAARPLL